MLFANLALSQIQTSSDPGLLQNTWRLGPITLPDQSSPSLPANQQSFLVFQGDQECTYLFLYGVLNLRQCAPFTANESTLTDQGGTYNWQIAINGHIKVPLALFLTINDPGVSQKTGLPVGTILGYVGNSNLPPLPNPTLIQGTWKLKIIVETDPSTGQQKSINPPADESAYGVFQGNQVCDHNFKGKVLKEKKCASFSIDGFNFSREGVTFNWGIDSNGNLELITIDGKIGAGFEKSTLPSATAPSPPPTTPKPSPTPPAKPVLPTPPTTVEKTPEAAGKTDTPIFFAGLGAVAGLFLVLVVTWIFRDFLARIGWIKRDESGKPLFWSTATDGSGWTLKGRLFLVLLFLISWSILWIGNITFVGLQEPRKDNLIQVSPKSEDKPVNNALVPKNLPSKSGEQLTFRPTPLPSGAVGSPYAFSFCRPALNRTSDLCSAFDKQSTNPTGGQPPYHFQLGSGVGFPPFGLSLNLNGLLTGMPTAAGTKQFQVCAVDQTGDSSCQTVSLTITPTVSPPTPVTQPKYDLTVTSKSCTFSRFFKENEFAGEIPLYRFRTEGTASVPVGATFRVNGNDYELSCGSWAKTTARCTRQEGQPETTSWSVTFESPNNIWWSFGEGIAYPAGGFQQLASYPPIQCQ